MKSTFISFEITLLVCFCGSFLIMNKDSVTATSPSRRFCGPELVQIMSDVCGGIYHSNGKRFQIKDLDDSSEGLSASYNSLDMPVQKFGLPQWMKAATFIRKNRNIVQECCHRQCSYYDLISYCGEPSSTNGGSLME